MIDWSMSSFAQTGPWQCRRLPQIQVFRTPVCLSVCHWMSDAALLCDGWLQRFSKRERGPGLFPLGRPLRVGYRYVWVILLHMTCSWGAEPLNLAGPCSIFLATCLQQRRNTSAPCTNRGRETKESRALIRRTCVCVCVALFSLQMCVFNHTHRKPKDNCFGFFLSPARTIATEVLFMRFWNNISLSLTIEDIPHVVINWISSLSLTKNFTILAPRLKNHW